MSIDWSAAPEGTDAYCEGHWLKRDGDNWLQQPVNSGWEAADFKPWKQNGFIYKKDALAAADARERAIDEMCIVAGMLGEFCTIERMAFGRLYDANYRKDDQ